MWVFFFLFLLKTMRKILDTSCSKQDLFKLYDRTALNLTLKTFTWKKILKIKTCDYHELGKLKK